MKGFALGITLLFLFLLTLLGFSILLIAGNYYSSVRNLTDNENARLLCESALEEMVNRHNLENATSRFFFDPASWQNLAMKPYIHAGFTVSAKLSGPWNGMSVNQLTVSARKGSHLGEQRAGIAQIRPENFALYSDAPVSLPFSSLFDGLVYVQDGMQLLQPEVRFREAAQGDFFPEDHASFKQRSYTTLAYPEIDSWLNAASFASIASTTGFVVSNKNALFWMTDGYELDLDQLHIDPFGKQWKIRYRGTDVAVVSTLLFWFDDRVTIHQAERSTSFLGTEKARTPFYVGSAVEVILESGVLSIEAATFTHPLCFISAGTIRIGSNVPQVCRVEACLIALGADVSGASLSIEPGGMPISLSQKDQFLFELNTSAFLHEGTKRDAMQTAMEAGRKIVWFRGSVIAKSMISFPLDLSQVHFQSSQDTYSLFPSFPFVRITEGSRQWR